MAGVFGLSDFRVEQLEGNVDESANYGYFAGGSSPTETPPEVTTIDRIDFFNETTSAPGNNLTEGRQALASVSNSNYGYFGGGISGSTRHCTIDRIDFSNETVVVPPVDNQLTQARNYILATFNSNYGYFAGGFSPTPPDYVCTIDRLDFSNETVAVPPVGDQLTQARQAFATVSSSNYGYFAGGVNGTARSTTIDRLDFSSETVAGPPIHGANLTVARNLLGSVSSSDYGYFAGGSAPTETPSYVATIDRIDFSNETVAAPGNNLTEGRQNLTGVFNSNYGYFAGGFFTPPPTRVCTIDRIDFSNETVAVPPVDNQLTLARTNLTGISGGKSVNARIRKSTDKNGKSISGKYAYYGGGQLPSSTLQNIDRMEYATETMTTLPSDYQLSQGRSELSAAGNSNYGYFIGGWSQPQASSKIDRMDFSNGTLTDSLSLNPPGFGTNGVRRTASLANNNYIYTAGGTGPASWNSDEIARMDLSTEVLTYSDGLTQGRVYMSALKTSSYGYFCGGEGPSGDQSTYQRLDFSTESANTSGGLQSKRKEFATIQSPEYGYLAGGDGDPSYQSETDKLDFSSETFSVISNDLSEGRENVNGFCNEYFGYIAGGWAPPSRSVIDRMEFSSETMSLPGVELQKGNTYNGGTVSDNGVTHN